MIEHVQVEGKRLGKEAKKEDPHGRTLQLVKYLDASVLAPAPPQAHWSVGVKPWGMALNDQIGDCLVEGTRVSASDALAGYRTRYSGEVIRLTFESGKVLTVTPNHAVLTPRGFLRAKFLHKGDHAIGTLGSKPLAVDGVNLDQSPTLIEEKVASLRGAGSRSGAVALHGPATADDFHGDGRFMHGDVNVVYADSLLQREVGQPSLRHPNRHRKVSTAGYLQGLLQRSGSTLQRRSFGGPAPLGSVSGSSDGCSFAYRQVGVSQAEGLGLASHRSTAGNQLVSEVSLPDSELLMQFSDVLSEVVPPEGFGQVDGFSPSPASNLRSGSSSGLMASVLHPAQEGRPTDPELPANFVRRYPGLVKSDCITQVERLAYKGHIYDLSTESRFYVADGIVTHNCVIAAQKHTVQCWTSAAGHEIDPTDNDVLHTYEAITGYNPNNPASDQGTNILDAMNYWRRVGIGGHKIGAFAEVNWQNQALVQDAIYYFIGGLELGVQLPISAQRMGTHWTMPSNTRGSNAPGSWGGHGIVGVDYDRYGVTVVSWGQLIKVDWRFFFTYFDEAYVALSKDFIKAATGKTYLGFDLATLQSDLSQLGHVE